MVKDEEDEVIQEIDVFVNQTLTDDLYVLQYPLRAPWNPYPTEAAAQFKEKSQFLTLNFTVPKTKEQIEDDRARVERAESVSDTTSFSLESSMQPMNATYAVGIYSEGQIHLNPLRTRKEITIKGEGENENQSKITKGGGILQMRPSFTHLNPEAPKQKESGGESTKLRKVGVVYQSKKQERIQSYQKQSYRYKMQQLEEEPEVQLNYLHHVKSFEASDKLDELIYDGESLETPFTLSRRQYLESIVTGASQPIAKNIPYGVCSRSKRETLPLIAQLMQLMKSVELMQFRRIRELISIPADDLDLIEKLQTIGHLIDGIWIIKSESCAAIRDNENMINTRDFILCELYKKPEGLFQGDLNKVVPLSPPETTQILEKLCEPHQVVLVDEEAETGTRTTRIWKLRVEREKSFNSTYPDVVEKQKQQWDVLSRKLARSFKKSETPILDQFFAEVFATYGVCNFAFLRTQVKNYVQKGGPFVALNDVSEIQFKKKLNSIADQLHSAFFLRVHPNEEVNKYRNIILDVFRSKPGPAITKREINAASKKHLNTPMPPSMYSQIMKELAYLSGGKWIFRTGHGKDG